MLALSRRPRVYRLDGKEASEVVCGEVEGSMPEEQYVFTASRWTSGNLFFPVRIELTPQHVSRITPHQVGRNAGHMFISRPNMCHVLPRTWWAPGRRAWPERKSTLSILAPV